MQTYEEVAQKAELDTGTSRRYCRYMRERWADQESLHCQVGYAMEWAMRFKNGIEYEASDREGQSILARHNTTSVLL